MATRAAKSAIYELIAELRPHGTTMMMRFEGLPGEFLPARLRRGADHLPGW